MFKAIKRKIATYYLFNQYYNARNYLEVNIRNRRSTDIENICTRVRCAGVAYASADYLTYYKDGSFSEECYCKNNPLTGAPELFSRYNDFIKDLEEYIDNIRNIVYKI